MFDDASTLRIRNLLRSYMIHKGLSELEAAILHIEELHQELAKLDWEDTSRNSVLHTCIYP